MYNHNSNPIWYKLTKLFKKQGIINTGLTLPYLYGSYELLGKPLESIFDLLNEIRQHNIDKYPVIQMCGTIHQHVVATEDKNIYNKKYIKDVKLLNKKNEIDLIISSNTNLGKSNEEIYKSLILRYQKIITAGTYSWYYKEQEWKIFSPEERRIILSIK